MIIDHHTWMVHGMHFANELKGAFVFETLEKKVRQQDLLHSLDRARDATCKKKRERNKIE